MPEFKVSFSYQQGPSHHDPDYMDPDAQMQTFHGSSTIDATDEVKAAEKLKEEKPYVTITGVEGPKN